MCLVKGISKVKGACKISDHAKLVDHTPLVLMNRGVSRWKRPLFIWLQAACVVNCKSVASSWQAKAGGIPLDLLLPTS